MESRTERIDNPAQDGSFYNLATVSIDGRDYTSGGGEVDLWNGRIFAYWTSSEDDLPGIHNPYPSTFNVTDWEGNQIAVAEVISSWRTPTSFLSSRRYAIRFDFAGHSWHGTAFGPGMYLRARRGKPLSNAVQ